MPKLDGKSTRSCERTGHSLESLDIITTSMRDTYSQCHYSWTPWTESSIALCLSKHPIPPSPDKSLVSARL